MNTQDYLKHRGVHFDVLPHETAYTAAAVAHKAHLPEAAMAKTVLLRANHGYRDVVAVVPANAHVDLGKLSRLLGGAELQVATENEIARHCPECEVGVLPPFGSQYNLETVVDERVAKNEEIAFEGDTHHDVIRMRFADYRQVESPLVGDIAAP